MASSEKLLDDLQAATDEAAELAEYDADYGSIVSSLESLQAQVQELIEGEGEQPA